MGKLSLEAQSLRLKWNKCTPPMDFQLRGVHFLGGTAPNRVDI